MWTFNKIFGLVIFLEICLAYTQLPYNSSLLSNLYLLKRNNSILHIHQGNLNYQVDLPFLILFLNKVLSEAEIFKEMCLLWLASWDLEFQIKSWFHFATVITRSHFPSRPKISLKIIRLFPSASKNNHAIKISRPR